MARTKRPEDQKFEWTAKGYPRCRIRCGKGEQLWVTFHTKDEDVFHARRARLQAVAGGLSAKGLTDAAKIILRKAGAAESNEAFDALVERAGHIVGSTTPRERRRRWYTFEEFATAYYSGALAAEYPAHVKVKATMKDDKGKLKYLSTIVGDVPVEHFTVEHAMLAMKKLPATCKTDTTRNSYWQVMHRLLELAAFPAALIPHNPLLREHRPELTDAVVHYPFAYPLDDYRMMSYRGQASSEGLTLSDPIVQAFLGIGCREGGRLGEFLRKLTWAGCDAVYRRLNVGTRKNGRVGGWPAQPGTLETLFALREVVPGLGDLPGPFFALPDDDQWSKRYRKLAEVAGAREELYKPTGAGRAAIRAYDTRATFVTLAKAYDFPEPWIMRRTGHEHSTMLATYDHARDDWREHNLGKLVRLDVAIGRDRLGLPELTDDVLAAEAEARRLATEGDDDDDGGPGGGGGAIRLDSGKIKTGHETERRFLVRNSVPRNWQTSMFSAVPKPGVEPGSPEGAADFESPAGVHEATDGGLNARNPVTPSDRETHPVSPETARVRLEMPPAERALAALVEASHAAVDARDWALVAALGELIDKRRSVDPVERVDPVAPPVAPPAEPAPATAAAPAVSRLDEARRRREGGR